ncbi:dynamin family protein [Paenibacillus lactis]|uniref:dynamin family protein n=1 Tax=Paenibacillus lactis TaxID=228574 RepID=UPI0036BAEC29
MRLSLDDRARMLFEVVQEEYFARAKPAMKAAIQENTRALEEILDRMKQIPHYENSALLKPFCEMGDSTAVEIHQLGDAMEQPFMLFIMGMGKYGKSTLINALLRQKVAEMDFLPKTWKIDIFESHEVLNTAQVKRKDGTVQQLGVEECKALLKAEEDKQAASSREAGEEFRKQSAAYRSIEEKEELKKLIYDKMLYRSDIVEVRWPVQVNSLLKNFRLVDTPGLVQNLLGEVKVSIHEYYHKADGVIWMLDATTISARKSREMMDKLEQALSDVGGRTDNMIAVLNSIDKVRKSGGEEAVQSVTEQANHIFGDIFKQIVPLSAKEALDGLLTGDRELIERSGIIRLHQVIHSHFLPEAQRMQLVSKQVGLRNVCYQLGQEAAKYQTRLEQDLNTFIKGSEAFQENLNVLIQKIDKSNQHFFEKYISKVNRNIETKAELLFDYNEAAQQQSYLESSIFQLGWLKREVEKLRRKYAAMLQEFYDYHAPKAVFKEYVHLSIDKLPTNLRQEVQLQVDTQSFDFDASSLSFLSGAGMFVAGGLVLGPLGLVLAGIASVLGLAKWLAVKMKLSGLKQELHQTLVTIIEKMEAEMIDSLNSQLEDISNRIQGIRYTTFAELHGDIQDSEELLELLVELRSRMSSPDGDLHIKQLLIDLFQEGKQFEHSFITR